MPVFNTVDELYRGVQDTLDGISETRLIPTAKKILKKHIQTDIYDAYTPTPNGWKYPNGIGGWIRATYQRRHVLEQDNNIVHFRYDKTGYMVTSKASMNTPLGKQRIRHGNGLFLKMLEEGDMGFWRKGFPRPAVSNAQKEMDEYIKYHLDSFLKVEFMQN